MYVANQSKAHSDKRAKGRATITLKNKLRYLVTEQFYAIGTEKRVQHPLVQQLLKPP